jgi:hypothetical protein
MREGARHKEGQDQMISTFKRQIECLKFLKETELDLLER